MNVFVLCTGRCGSTTMALACQHITNFSADHESLAMRLGDARLNYPENHIEIDNRLSWYLGKLDQKYGDDAYYVHLQRDAAQVIDSFVKRKGFGIMKAFEDGLIRLPSPDLDDPRLLAKEIVEVGTSNIMQFLKGKKNQMEFHLENVEHDFPKFWNWIGAEGDFDAAVDCWSSKHNASDGNMKKTVFEKAIRKIRKVAEGRANNDPIH